MEKEIVLEYFVDQDGMLSIHVASNTPIENPSPKWGDGTVTEEDGTYHFRARRMYEGVINIRLEGWKNPRIFVLRALDKKQRMRDTIKRAAEEFQRMVGEVPDFALVKYIPRSVENIAEVEVGKDRSVLLFAVEWMMETHVAVGWKEVISDR